MSITSQQCFDSLAADQHNALVYPTEIASEKDWGQFLGISEDRLEVREACSKLGEEREELEGWRRHEFSSVAAMALKSSYFLKLNQEEQIDKLRSLVDMVNGGNGYLWFYPLGLAGTVGVPFGAVATFAALGGYVEPAIGIFITGALAGAIGGGAIAGYEYWSRGEEIEKAMNKTADALTDKPQG